MALEVVAAKKLLPRRMPYPDFALRQPVTNVATGSLRTGVAVEKLWKDRSPTQIGPKLGGFREAELETIPSIDLQKMATGPGTPAGQAYSWPDALALGEKTYRILDFGTNLSGFIGATVTCRRAGRLYVTFDEILTNSDVDFKRLGCVNALTYELPPGAYRLESFEPYTLRYLKFMAAEGEYEVSKVFLREYANPNVWDAQFASSDERLNRLFTAGRETYRQNAVDLFTDCPHRERAGWLCDSFFTSRVARVLNGNTVMEHAFFENYLLPESFANMPKGMLPMCYPADHNDGVFIPNWALWFVVQLEEYLQRSGDRETVDALRPKVTGVFDYFKRFRNSDGLLENLENWVFIEWSDANKFVNGVNYPSNMLYAAAMASAGRLYKDPAMLAEADRLRRVIAQQSFDGEFFVDNAVRKNGVLRPTGNRTEVCQYFAFYFDVASRERHGKLWSKLEKEFGPQRKQTSAYADVRPANAFVGNYLRLELLSRFGMVRQLLDESVSYLLYMADRTGTLWENDDAYASCNHGFASHAVYSLFRDVLGVAEMDTSAKAVRVRIADIGLDWCEGRVPAAGGFVSLRWKRQGGKVVYKLDVPAGYTAKVEGAAGLELTPEM